MVEVTFQEVMLINKSLGLLLRRNAQDVSSHEQVACSGSEHALKGGDWRNHVRPSVGNKLELQHVTMRMHGGKRSTCVSQALVGA